MNQQNSFWPCQRTQESKQSTMSRSLEKVEKTPTMMLYLWRRVNDVAHTPKTCVSLEDQQENHQSALVEVPGRIDNQFILVLIDHRAGKKYITPKLVETFCIYQSKHRKPMICSPHHWN